MKCINLNLDLWRTRHFSPVNKLKIKRKRKFKWKKRWCVGGIGVYEETFHRMKQKFKLISHKNPPVSLLNNPILLSWHPSNTRVAGAKNVLIDFHLFFSFVYTRWRPKGKRRRRRRKQKTGNGKTKFASIILIYTRLFFFLVGVWGWRARGFRRVFLISAHAQDFEGKTIFVHFPI